MEAVFFALWILFAFGIAAWASSRGRSPWGFFFLALIFSPILAGVVLLIMQDLTQKAVDDEDKRREHEQRLQEIKALTAHNQRTEAAPAPAAVIVPTPTVSVADELLKLADLREKGILTEEEFNAQKTALLKR